MRSTRFIVLLFLSIMASSKASQVFQEPKEGKNLIGATNRFAWDLYKALSLEKTGENLFLSPASISVALGMTYLGAKNKTLTQMADVLHFSDVAPEYLQQSLSDLLKALKGQNEDYILRMANRLYGQEGFPFLQTFLDASKTYYNAEMQSVNFGNEPQTRQEINAWVEEQTANKIQDLIKPGVLNALTKLVLVNAIYFKGDWLNKFDKESTVDEDFFIESDKTVKTSMMHHDRKFNFGFNRDLKAQILELPYKGEKLSMFVLLPQEKNGLAELEENLTFDQLNNLEKNFRMSQVKTIVSLPKFKLENSFDLDETLKPLGMVDLFDANKADLSGIDGKGLLFVSKVVHKAFINVDEEGSEAAAATAGIMMMRSMPRIMEFNANHPFLFLIRENQTGSILFLGRMVQPAPHAGGKSEL